MQGALTQEYQGSFEEAQHSRRRSGPQNYVPNFEDRTLGAGGLYISPKDRRGSSTYHTIQQWSQNCTMLYNRVMKISISEVRQRLPELVRQVKDDDELRIQITVHGDVAAELRGCAPEPSPGAAAIRIQELIGKLPAHRGRKRNISGQVGQHLYGKRQE